MDIGKPATPSGILPTILPYCCTTRDSGVLRSLQRQRTLRHNAEKSKRCDHLCSVRLRKLPFVLLRLLSGHASILCPTMLAELAQVRSHYVGVLQTVQQRERGRDRTNGKNGRIGRLISLIGDCNVAGPQPSEGDRIGDEIGESKTDRADELAHL